MCVRLVHLCNLKMSCHGGKVPLEFGLTSRVNMQYSGGGNTDDGLMQKSCKGALCA